MLKDKETGMAAIRKKKDNVVRIAEKNTNHIV